MNKIIAYYPHISRFYFRGERFITLSFSKNDEGFPQFISTFKKEGNKLNRYSLVSMKLEESYDFDKFFSDYEDVCFNGCDCMVLEGDPIEFMRYISSNEVYNYFLDVCKNNFEEVPFPPEFTKENVDKYLDILQKKYSDYLYSKSITKDFRDLKKQQLITWGISITSLLLTLYKIIFN